jgi:hypothetical protein
MRNFNNDNNNQEDNVGEIKCINNTLEKYLKQ